MHSKTPSLPPAMVEEFVGNDTGNWIAPLALVRFPPLLLLRRVRDWNAASRPGETMHTWIDEVEADRQTDRQRHCRVREGRVEFAILYYTYFNTQFPRRSFPPPAGNNFRNILLINLHISVVPAGLLSSI